MERYYQKEIETADREQILAWQNERLVRQVRHVWDNVPYYRAKMEEKGVTPEEIQSVEDLHKLPFLTKDDLREAYPYGLLAAPLKDCVRIQSTSGTTGRRVVAFYTRHDIDLWEDCCALPMSSGNTDRQLQFMVDLGATILCCTPSYAAFLAETIQERGLRDQIRLRAGIFGAEAWSEEMRHDIQNKLGIKAYDIYGLTETSGPGVAFECSEQTGMHINEDHFIAEIIDPDTGEVLPEGSKGELVFTAISKEAFPLLRYRTRDICVLTRKKCSCGRTHVKMSKPMGRSDDMLIVKGVNVFPSQIETVLLEQGYPANYQIIVDRVNNSDTLEVMVEMTPENFSDNLGKITEMEKGLVSALKAMLGIYARVRLVAPKSITRSEGKAVRVIDKRKI